MSCKPFCPSMSKCHVRPLYECKTFVRKIQLVIRTLTRNSNSFACPSSIFSKVIQNDLWHKTNLEFLKELFQYPPLLEGLIDNLGRRLLQAAKLFA